MLKDWITPARTVLLIIDMQADFASAEGALGRAGAPVDCAGPALAAAGRLAEAARMAGVAVVFVGLATSPETDSPAWRERLLRSGRNEGELALCRAGSKGAAFVGPMPQTGERVIAKTRYSALVGTPLEDELRRSGRDTLVLAGMTTECCIDSTARDAFHRDLHVIIAGDACAGYDEALHRTSLEALALNFALVRSSEEICAAWS